MPISSVCFRAVCGTFYWTFLTFMNKRAREKAAMRVRCVSALVLVFLVAFLLQCGDVEMNPGPGPKHTQPKITDQSHRKSLGGEDNTNTEDPTIADVVKMLNALDQKMTTMDKKMDSMH
eukprot:TRINITY_DN65360_c0_g1_i2.p2 TRINITY_DN65360_c0_g1~~TRINITY_DN65360_c0_g1_i2.p2  ORF type:complete len:119 (-),score=17.33 TRINITY_DN65360_c0_g1_i2:14-370(-)